MNIRRRTKDGRRCRNCGFAKGCIELSSRPELDNSFSLKIFLCSFLLLLSILHALLSKKKKEKEEGAKKAIAARRERNDT